MEVFIYANVCGKAISSKLPDGENRLVKSYQEDG
ncbi:hypothetical protein Cpin_5509 [Chitinophaga pinensis DSM 2588]|uniref:Uncharacterized protein n=1 Tax=Chitinophaga pinensis (strain ATCC 43595 / DSM 2588 / LMG 13176 / NBRC 15968 / NCIMB 11800 / UQM 2034) TaxID=485918 RepID=A0A979G921_CHIPD|nr:hypothetical protein Cpin_5509 [Chitinophaga pinensis DSM 2588]